VENRNNMDFTNRGTSAQQPQHQNTQPINNANTASPSFSSKKRRQKTSFTKWFTFIFGALIVLLLLALVIVISFSEPKSESNYIYTNKLQAVFLNTGQVYFGNITNINPQFLTLTNIFYLQTNSSSSKTNSSSSNVTLVKLGCELHAPYDLMVVNMSQVTFWENLKSSGQVAKAVAQYHKEYPHGQTCSNQTSASGTNVQNAPTTGTGTTPSIPSGAIKH